MGEHGPEPGQHHGDVRGGVKELARGKESVVSSFGGEDGCARCVAFRRIRGGDPNLLSVSFNCGTRRILR